MKKIFFICAVFLVINQYAFSQERDRKVTIQLSPLLFLSDIFTSEGTRFSIDLEGQFKVADHSNISATVSFLLHNDNRYGEDLFQVNLKPMYIYRPLGTGLKGFYLGLYPNIGFQYVKGSYENQLYTEIGFGLNVGYKWVFRGGFTMQAGGGVGKTFSLPKKSDYYAFYNSDGRITLKTTDLFIDFKLGYSF